MSGVLCDRRVSVRMKGLFGEKTVALKKRQEGRAGGSRAEDVEVLFWSDRDG